VRLFKTGRSTVTYGVNGKHMQLPPPAAVTRWRLGLSLRTGRITGKKKISASAIPYGPAIKI